MYDLMEAIGVMGVTTVCVFSAAYIGDILVDVKKWVGLGVLVMYTTTLILFILYLRTVLCETC